MKYAIIFVVFGFFPMFAVYLIVFLLKTGINEENNGLVSPAWFGVSSGQKFKQNVFFFSDFTVDLIYLCKFNMQGSMILCIACNYIAAIRSLFLKTATKHTKESTIQTIYIHGECENQQNNITTKMQRERENSYNINSSTAYLLFRKITTFLILIGVGS